MNNMGHAELNTDSRPILVAGGAGFIGANFIIDRIAAQQQPVVCFDKLTYAGNLANLAAVRDDPLFEFVRGDICDRASLRELLARVRPSAIVNFAAESHVDRSIHDAHDFVDTNIVGAFNLLECAREYWEGQAQQETFRFLHVSTDEVYGSLSEKSAPFCETDPFRPNSPYAASKAASDTLMRAWHRTYGLPIVTTNCSNNYGPFQFPEKLIPFAIHRALAHETLPLYGDGLHVRDWLYVADHCAAIRAVLEFGRPGETYNVGGCAEKTNLDVVTAICGILDREVPRDNGRSYREQIAFVADRPGHDRRYAINAEKITSETGWSPRENFASGLEKTVRWYLANSEWSRAIVSGAYRNWIERNYAARETAPRLRAVTK
jgi:dTDP-glucose 4,6-dehydratase